MDNSSAVEAAAGVAQNGIVLTSLSTTARILNVDSQGSVASASANELTIAGSQSVGKVSITGDQAFKLTTGANAIGSVDGSKATGKLEVVATDSTGVDNKLFITGGSANDTIVASNNVGITNTITGGLGADTINAGTAKSVIVLTSQADSTATAFDAVTGFAAGTDVVNLAAFNIAGSAQKVAATTKATVDVGTGISDSTFTVSAANAAGFFTSGGVQNGVAVVVDSTTAADGAFAFIDVDGDGNWNAATDSVIALVGADYSAITAASFAFV